MKIRLFILLFLLAFTMSCKDFLEVKPHSFSSDANYYQTEGQVLRAVNGVYASVQELFTNDFWALTEMRADNTNYQFDESDRGAQQREEIDEFLITSTNNYVATMWNLLYRNIQQANVVIGRSQDVEFADSELKNRYLAEVKFLRAQQYFYLVRLFGSVPLVVEEVSGPTEAFTGTKASVEEVYAQIIQDAQEAAAALPVSYSANELGRATKRGRINVTGRGVYDTQRVL